MPFLIHMSNLGACVICRVRLPVRLAWQKFNVGICTQTFQQFSFLPALPVSTVALYHFILLSVILTFAGGHKVSGKRNLLFVFIKLKKNSQAIGMKM